MRLAVIVSIALAGGVVLGNGAFSAAVVAGLDATGPHGAWYASRAAGIASYLFLWMGLAGGLLMSSAWFDGFLSRARLLAFHQTSSIAGVLLGLAHALVLIPDGWTHFHAADLFVPFVSYYRPVPTAVGTLALYLSATVSVSFWFRRQLGMKVWRCLHYTSALAFAGAFWHGVSLGTDSRQPWLLGTYLATSLTVVFGVMLRITYRRSPVRRVSVAKNPERQAA